MSLQRLTAAPGATTDVGRGTVVSIQAVLLTLGGLSILVAAGLAGFGYLGIQRQLQARARVVVLEQALGNHVSADNFMDDVRADVLRAVLSKAGTNKEGEQAIRAEVQHHSDVVSSSLAENLTLSLSPELHNGYARIAGLAKQFIGAGQRAVNLALTDQEAGAANFETFRGHFSELEDLMDGMRDLVRADVKQVRAEAVRTARQAERMIVASAVVGVVLLMVITTVAVRIVQGITAALASSRIALHRLALHDTLTGLPNRVLFSERANESLAQAQRHGTMVAVLCLDLDHFKQVNDTLGHPVGDLLLQEVAARLGSCLRKTDTVARLGGDEFAVIQDPLHRIEEAGILSQRIIEAISQPYVLNGNQVIVGASVGAALTSGDATSAAHLLKMADVALYRAKADGRGVFRLFEPDMYDRLQERRALELDLRRALERQEFELHYQPLIELCDGRITVLEALVRWRHPTKGLIAPDDFIPVAEETGLIVPIGNMVLQRACADAAGWPPLVRVAVNVSAVQFKGSGLVMAVRDALAASGLGPARLELEITESAFLADADATLDVLRRLREAGVRIAMDDFGTGYSSLGYLRSFPFDKVKIDRCFIKDIETSADCRAIVRAVTSLGSNLGIATTAEGVETVAQLNRVRAEGCDQVQGYLFSRPVPASEVAGLFVKTLEPCPVEVERVSQSRPAFRSAHPIPVPLVTTAT